MNWEFYKISNRQDLVRLIDMTASLFVPSNSPELWQEPCLLEACLTTDKQSPLIGVLNNGGNVLGLATFIEEPNTLNIALGPIRLFAKRITRLVMTNPPLFASDVSEADRKQQSLSLLEAVLARSPQVDVALLMALDVTTPLMSAVRTKSDDPASRRITAVTHGNDQSHCSIILQPSFDAYLASLGKSTRKDFRKTLKKFASADQPSKLAVFSAVDECQKFFDDALIVSKKTWQYLNEGAGLKDQDKLLTQYRIAAERGWFRSYILYYGEQPVAFQEGYVYGATYYAEQIGYDPAFASHQIGVVLLLEMIRDLIENCPGIQCVDLGATENELKRRVSAAQVIDGYSYIFRRDAKSASLLTALRMANGLTDQLKKVLGRESSPPKASRPQ